MSVHGITQTVHQNQLAEPTAVNCKQFVYSHIWGMIKHFRNDPLDATLLLYNNNNMDIYIAPVSARL